MERPVVPLLVPLRTGIWCILARRGAVWKSLVTICNKGGYSRQCDYVQGGAATPKIGLKIRRPQGRGGSSPPPGTKISNYLRAKQSITSASHFLTHRTRAYEPG